MKKIYSVIIAIIVFLVFIFPLADAKITGVIGNGKVVLRPEVKPGETKVIERTLYVRNPNDIPVNIELKTDDSLKDIVDLIDVAFTLQPSQEKEARFNIILKDTRSYQGNIGVYFKFGGKEGIALTSTLTIIGDTPIDIKDDIPDEDSINDSVLDEEDFNVDLDGLDDIGGAATKDSDLNFDNDYSSKKENSLLENKIGIIFGISLIFVFLVLGGFIYLLRK